MTVQNHAARMRPRIIIPDLTAGPVGIHLILRDQRVPSLHGHLDRGEPASPAAGRRQAQSPTE